MQQEKIIMVQVKQYCLLGEGANKRKKKGRKERRKEGLTHVGAPNRNRQGQHGDGNGLLLSLRTDLNLGEWDNFF